MRWSTRHHQPRCQHTLCAWIGWPTRKSPEVKMKGHAAQSGSSWKSGYAVWHWHHLPGGTFLRGSLARCRDLAQWSSTGRFIFWDCAVGLTSKLHWKTFLASYIRRLPRTIIAREKYQAYMVLFDSCAFGSLHFRSCCSCTLNCFPCFVAQLRELCGQQSRSCGRNNVSAARANLCTRLGGASS